MNRLLLQLAALLLILHSVSSSWAQDNFEDDNLYQIIFRFSDFYQSSGLNFKIEIDNKSTAEAATFLAERLAETRRSIGTDS